MHVFRLKGDFETLDAYTPLLFDLGARGLEEKPGEVWAYFPTRLELPLPGEWAELPDTDWLEAWRRDLKPVKAGPFVVLAPWHQWEGPERRILLEPGMAFGTGHHETTRMALEAVAEHVQPVKGHRPPPARWAERAGTQVKGPRVLDLGTGSGILAIAAQMLGARAVGIDNDPAVIPQALENAAANGVSPEFYVGTLENAEGTFDVIVANLYAELHARLAPEYPRYLVPGGLMLITGILSEREGLVDRAMRSQGFEPLHRRQEGEWVHLIYRKP